MHLILFCTPCPFIQRTGLPFASHLRAENLPNHYFPSSTLSPSPNLRGSGVGAVRGSARRAAALQSSVRAGVRLSLEFTVHCSVAVRIRSCVLTRFHNRLPRQELFSGTASTEPPKQRFDSAHLAGLVHTRSLRTLKMSQSSPLSAHSFPSLRVRNISICLLVKDVFYKQYIFRCLDCKDWSTLNLKKITRRKIV